MKERLDRLERQVEELIQSQDKLVERLAVLENRSKEQPEEATEYADQMEAAGETIETEMQSRSRLDGLGSLIGRSFIVLGGAFYLRSLTDGGTLSRSVGVTLGLVYAAIWILLALRAGSRGRPLSGVLHNLTAAVIAFPLIWEATTSFEVLSAEASAIVLVGFTGLGMAVAWRNEQRAVAWIAILFSVTVGLGLLFWTRALVPYSVQLSLVALGSLWLGYTHDWPEIPWPGAVVVNALVGLTTLATITEPQSWFASQPVVFVQLSLVAIYLSSFAVRHVVMGKRAWVFDGIQTTIVFLLGFEGAAYLAQTTGNGVLLGVGALLVSACILAVAFTRVRRRQGRGTNYFFYTILGAFLLVEGCRLTLPPNTAAVVLAGLVIATAWLSGRFRSLAVLRLHTAYFALAAAVISGLVAIVIDDFSGPATGVWRPFHLPAIVVFVAATAAFALLRRHRTGELPRWACSPPEMALLLITLAGLGAFVMGRLAAPLVGAGVATADAGALSVLRTAFIAISAATLAVIGRSPTRRDLRRLATIILGIGFLKFVVEDLPTGRPATLFLSLVLLGGALIITARTARPRDGSVGESPSESPDPTSS